jgi:hypothetical protein
VDGPLVLRRGPAWICWSEETRLSLRIDPDGHLPVLELPSGANNSRRTGSDCRCHLRSGRASWSIMTRCRWELVLGAATISKLASKGKCDVLLERYEHDGRSYGSREGRLVHTVKTGVQVSLRVLRGRCQRRNRVILGRACSGAYATVNPAT